MYLSKSIKLFVILWLFSFNSLIGQSFSVSGFLTNKSNGEALVGAYVFCPQTEMGVLTNNYGHYVINLPYGTKNLIFIHENHFIMIDTLLINKNQFYNTELAIKRKDDIENDPFENPTVYDEESNFKKTFKNSEKTNNIIRNAYLRNIKIIDCTENGTINLPNSQVSNMPSILGEVDVVRSLKMLPGIAPGTELIGGLNIRGGSQDQNLMLMDGVPVYNSNHFLGIYSIFNTEAVNNIKVSKSGFSAREGGRLSGITDVVMKEGNSRNINGIFLQSLLAITFDINGPISDDGRTTFMFSGRRSYWDLFLKPFNTDSNSTNFNFHDINFKVAHQLKNNAKLVFSIYNGRDKLNIKSINTIDSIVTTVTNKDNLDIRWGNTLASVKYVKPLNERTFFTASMNYSLYKGSFFIETFQEQTFDTASPSSRSFKLDYRNQIQDFIPKIDFDYVLNKNNTLKFGAVYSHKIFNYRSLFSRTTNSQSFNGTNANGRIDNSFSNELAVYIEDDININSSTKSSVGVRLVNYNYQGYNILLPEPRISINKRLQNNVALKGSYTLMNQTIHLLANNRVSSYSDRWVPANDVFKPQQVHQFSASIVKPLFDGYDFSGDAYFKLYTRVEEAKEGSQGGNIFSNEDWQNSVVLGKGKSYGLELFLHKRRGDFNGWIGYSFSQSQRNATEINNGKDYYFQFDRRHYFNLAINQIIDERHAISFTTVISSGNVQSIPTGKYLDINGNLIYEYEQKNNYRLPMTFRMDFGLTRARRNAVFYESGYRFSIYNFTAFHNTAFINIDDSTAPAKAYKVNYLKFVPGITYFTKF